MSTNQVPTDELPPITQALRNVWHGRRTEPNVEAMQAILTAVRDLEVRLIALEK